VSRQYVIGSAIDVTFVADEGGRDFITLAAFLAGEAVAGGVAGVKVWTGSAWVEKPAKVWSGSAWTQKPVKTWSGSAWT
jgi:hypothetical protein